MKPVWSALAALAWLTATPSSAALSNLAPRQSASAIAVGMAVVDDAGHPVGEIVSFQGDDVLVRTDRQEARIPRTSLWPRRGRLVLGMTRAQLNAAVDRLAPAPQAQLVPGVLVRGTGGALAGTIEEVGPEHVILRLSSGERASLPRASVGVNAAGAVISITADELQRMVERASPAAAD